MHVAEVTFLKTLFAPNQLSDAPGNANVPLRYDEASNV